LIGGAIILFAAYSVYGRISVHFFPRNFRHSLALSPSKLFAKNSSDKLARCGNVLFAAYSVYRRISVFSLKICIFLQHCPIQNFWLKMVLINSQGGTNVTYAAYTAS